MDIQEFVIKYINADVDVRNQIKEIVSIFESLPVCQAEDLISSDRVLWLPQQ